MAYTIFKAARLSSRRLATTRIYDRRFYSIQLKLSSTEVLKVMSELGSMPPESIDLLKYFKLLELTQSESLSGKHKSESDSTILSTKDMAELYNQLIKSFAKDDYSIATVAKNALSRLPEEPKQTHRRRPDITALFELIKYNPGRVYSSWEMFMNEIYNDSQNLLVIQEDLALRKQVVTIMVEKLLYGDPIEIEDGLVTDVRRLSEIHFVMKHYGMEGVELPLSVQDHLLEKAFELNCPWLINDLKIHHEILEVRLHGHKHSKCETALVYLNLWKQVGNNADAEYLIKMMPFVARISKEGAVTNSSEQESWLKFESYVAKLGMEEKTIDFTSEFQAIFDEMGSIIKTKKFDTGADTIAEKLQCVLINAHGVQRADLEEAESLFKYYKESSPNVSIITAMAVVYCYQSCLTRSNSFIQTSQDLVKSSFSANEVPVRCLQALILSNAFLGNTEEALELFNKNIVYYNKTSDPQTGMSDAALVTESLILGYLCNLDREFAYLINDGAVANGIVDSEITSLRFKNLFKIYGRAFEEDDESKARSILQSHLINAMKLL